MFAKRQTGTNDSVSFSISIRQKLEENQLECFSGNGDGFEILGIDDSALRIV